MPDAAFGCIPFQLVQGSKFHSQHAFTFLHLILFSAAIVLRNFLGISTSHQYDIQNVQCFTQTFFFSWRGAIQTELPGEVVESVGIESRFQCLASCSATSTSSYRPFGRW